jgi:hypothetical protein
MMPGTITRRLVVVSSWESGSCFTSELLVSHPGAYYQPEPLKQFGGIRIRDPTEEKADIVYKVVSGLLNCNNSALKGTFQLLRVRFCLHLSCCGCAYVYNISCRARRLFLYSSGVHISDAARSFLFTRQLLRVCLQLEFFFIIPRARLAKKLLVFSRAKFLVPS